MQTRDEARRLESLEADAIDALALLWAAAHPVAKLDASTKVVAAPLPKVQAVPDTTAKENVGTEATVCKGQPTLPTCKAIGSKKRMKMATIGRYELRKAALKLIAKAKRDNPLAGLYDLKQGVNRVLRDLTDPKRPKMVSRHRLELEISVLKIMKKELSVLVPKPKLKPWGVNGITKVIYLPS